MRVLRAGFSPLKGTRHLAVRSIALDMQGAVGDRTYCLVDVAGATVLRTVQHPVLTTVVAAATDSGGLSISLPDGRAVSATPTATGETITCDYWGRPTPVDVLDGPHGALLSDLLGKPVALARAPRRGVIYGAGVAILTRASLEELGARVDTAVDPARFRSTLVIDTDEAPFAEESWTGRDLTVGPVTLRIGGAIPRCAVIDIDPLTGERGTRLLRTLAGYRPLNDAGEPCFGVYAEVRTPGVIAVSDPAQGQP
ncbi:MAG: MOSC domain-containing protein [Nocardioides sp.]